LLERVAGILSDLDKELQIIKTMDPDRYERKSKLLPKYVDYRYHMTRRLNVLAEQGFGAAVPEIEKSSSVNGIRGLLENSPLSAPSSSTSTSEAPSPAEAAKDHLDVPPLQAIEPFSPPAQQQQQHEHEQHEQQQHQQQHEYEQHEQQQHQQQYQLQPYESVLDSLLEQSQHGRLPTLASVLLQEDAATMFRLSGEVGDPDHHQHLELVAGHSLVL